MKKTILYLICFSFLLLNAGMLVGCNGNNSSTVSTYSDESKEHFIILDSLPFSFDSGNFGIKVRIDTTKLNTDELASNTDFTYTWSISSGDFMLFNETMTKPIDVAVNSNGQFILNTSDISDKEIIWLPAQDDEKPKISVIATGVNEVTDDSITLISDGKVVSLKEEE